MKNDFYRFFVGCRPLTLMAAFLFCGNVSMAAAQGHKLSMRQNSVALSHVFKEIEKQTGYSFLVRNNDVNMNEKVSINVENKSVTEILETLFAGKNIQYEVKDDLIAVYKSQQV